MDGRESWKQLPCLCREGGPWRFKGTEKLGFQADGNRELIKNKQTRTFVHFLKVICILQIMPASSGRGLGGFRWKIAGLACCEEHRLRSDLASAAAAPGAGAWGQRCPRGMGTGKCPRPLGGVSSQPEARKLLVPGGWWAPWAAAGTAQGCPTPALGTQGHPSGGQPGGDDEEATPPGLFSSQAFQNRAANIPDIPQ